MAYPRNAASPPPVAIGAVVQISDGAVQTTGVTVYHRTTGTTETSGGGTTNVGGTTGMIYYTPTQAETNYESFELVAFKTGCIPAAVTVVTSASATAGVSIVPDTQKVDVNTIKTQAVTCGAAVTVRADVGAAAAPGSANGMLIGGSNAATTFATLTSTGAFTCGSTVLGNTTMGTLTQTGAVAWGATTYASVAITGAYSVGTTTTYTGNVTHSGTTTYTGAVSYGSTETHTGAVAHNGGITTTTWAASGNVSVGGTVAVTGTTTLTGAVSHGSTTTYTGAFTLTDLTTAGSVGKVMADTLADTNELQTDWANGGRLDLILDARSSHSAADVWSVATRTLTALDEDSTTLDIDGALASALATAWSTTTIAEDYPADNTAATPAELLYLILSVCSQFAISSTTLTTYKLDGTTTAATYTLDSATAPTQRIRAT